MSLLVQMVQGNLIFLMLLPSCGHSPWVIVEWFFLEEEGFSNGFLTENQKVK